MTAEQHKNRKFWMALLEFGDSEEDRQRNWNVYCSWKFHEAFGASVRTGDLDKFLELVPPDTCRSGDMSRLNKFAAEIGDHPMLVDLSSPAGKPLPMDFSGKEFPDHVSFAGRALFRADFSRTVFKAGADFRKTAFAGRTTFNKAKFLAAGDGLSSEARFSGSSFHGNALFHDLQFPDTTRFDGATFHRSAIFSRANLMPRIDGTGLSVGFAAFWQSRFKGDAYFNESVFGVGSNFENAKFDSDASFEKTDFQSSAWFNNAEFRSTTSFREASFDKPPKFFETEIHEDVDFSRVDWGGARQSYSRWRRRTDLAASISIEHDPGNAVRAWDRLALIMSRQEKPAERHEFFRLKMHAQRQRDGNSLLTAANWLFDVLSDYGWGLRRAFSWWVGHIAIGAVILADGWPTVWNSLPVSFSNSLAFLRLGSEGGYLYGPRKILESATSHAEWVIPAVGTVQAVLGPILLFLVLLTLRNRFRLG